MRTALLFSVTAPPGMKSKKPAEALRNPQQYAGNKRQAWSFVIY